MDRKLLRLRRQPCVTRFSQEHDEQALTDPDPVADLVSFHIAWQSFAASTHEQCVVCAPQVRSVHRRHQGDLKQNCSASRSLTHVGSNKSFVL